MDIEGLSQKFDGYHSEVKDLAEKLTVNQKHWEKVEAELNRIGLARPGPVHERIDMRQIGDALRSFIKSGDESALSDIRESKTDTSFRGMMVGNDILGGYAAYPGLSATITSRVFELSPVRRRARKVTVSGGDFQELLDLDEAGAEWIGETTGRIETGDPTLGLMLIPVREMYALTRLTQTLLDDATLDLASWVVDKMASRFARKEGDAFVNGDGVAKPRGFLQFPTAATADATRPWGTLQYVPTGAASAFAASNPGDALIDLVYSLKVDFRQNASWQMNRKTAAVIRKFKDGQGNYLWSDSFVAGQPNLLLGHPVDFNESMPDLGANAFPVAFGDFNQGYTVVDRMGLRLIRDPFTFKPYVTFYTYMRVGGSVSNFEAIKLLKCATS